MKAFKKQFKELRKYESDINTSTMIKTIALAIMRD